MSVSSNSWATPQPQQRYSAVPGFDASRPESLHSNPTGNTGGNTTPEEKAVGGYELDNFNGAPPPAHRASIYSDPFGGNSPSPSQHRALLNDDSSMYSEGNNRPTRNNYAQMDGPNSAGAGAGYGAQHQYPVGHGTQNATADDLWGMEGGNGHQKYAGEAPAKSGSKKWLWIALVALLVCIGVGVGVGVGISQSNKSKSGGSSSAANAHGSSGSGSSGTTGGSTTTVADGSDPSVFDKDPALKQSFWGLAYTPKDSIYPDCWANISTVTKDIQLLSQLTKRIRLYGAMCNTTALVLQAIKDTKVDMQVYAAIYIDSNEDAYDTQVKAIGDAFATYGVDNVEGVAVGNEFLLIDMTAAGSGDVDPTKSTYLPAVKKLVPYITKFRASLASWNLSKTIKVGTGDAGALMSTALGEYIDYFMANVHPWFAGTTVEDGPAWTYNYFMEADVAPALNSSRQVDTYIAETGWPTGHDPLTKEGSDSRAGGGKDATLANLQIFLDNYVCQANTNGTKYFYFEPFDEEWKAKKYGGVEGYWGLFNHDRTLKDIKIPDCPV